MPSYAVHRLTNLVAHGREKHRLRFVGTFGLVKETPERLQLFRQDRDIG